MQKKKFLNIFWNAISEFILNISAFVTVVGAFYATTLGNWKVLIAIPFGCILIAIITAWICTLIQGKGE